MNKRVLKLFRRKIYKIENVFTFSQNNRIPLKRESISCSSGNSYGKAFFR
jgi:hypothetical protein